jgi:AcrR family transcriptional regulator
VRAARAEATRTRIVEAAAAAFGANGFSGTTLSAVAGAAGVSVETIYLRVGGKPELLDAALDLVVAGDAEPVAVADREDFARLATGDLATRLAYAAEITARDLTRASGVIRAYREAAATDDVMAARWRHTEQRRRRTVVAGFALVLGRPPSETEADAVWAIAGPEVWDKLRLERRWSRRRYEEWIAEMFAVIGGVSRPSAAGGG